MKKALSNISTVFIVLSIVGIISVGIYGMAKLGKIISYNWWYKDMVQQTVKEMVKETSLK